jgi:tetratricopeptide (TPR) repeat protein
LFMDRSHPPTVLTRFYSVKPLLLGLVAIAVLSQLIARAEKPTPVLPEEPAPSSTAPGSSNPARFIFADPFPSPASVPAQDLLIQQKAEIQAEALTFYTLAAIKEESGETEEASALYQKALSLDPGNAALAVRLSTELIAKGQVAEALRLLKDANAASPKNVGALVQIARTYLGVLKRPDSALTYAEKAYKLAPEDIPVLAVYLETCAAGSLNQRVEDALKKSLQSTQQDVDFWIQAGTLFRNALITRGAVSKVLLGKINDFFKTALNLAPIEPSVLEAASDHYTLTKQFPEAASFYQRALVEHRQRKGSLSAGLCLKLARVLLMSEQVPEAMGVLEELVSEQPTVAPARELLGELHLQQGHIIAALTHFKIALDAEPDRVEDHIRVTQLQLRLKRAPEAAATAQHARTLFPDIPQLTMLTAVALAEAKQHQEALHCFALAERQFLNSRSASLDAGFYFTYGAAAERAGLPEQASRLLLRSIELDPENSAEALNYLGYMWVDRNQNLEEAGTYIQKALALRPNHPAYLDSLGWWHFKKGQYEDALREIRKALDKIKREDASEVYDHLGDILEKLSKPEEAIAAWKVAVELDPAMPEVQKKIRQLQDNQ